MYLIHICIHIYLQSHVYLGLLSWPQIYSYPSILFPTRKHQNSPVTALTNIPKGIPHRCFQIIGRLENITIFKTLKEGE